ncbi:hypothetical protein HK101_001289 [Irineochytrium annulatum]|nr:hypothetical protein HK101_001289 [Irineochytrium annulatum]
MATATPSRPSHAHLQSHPIFGSSAALQPIQPSAAPASNAMSHHHIPAHIPPPSMAPPKPLPPVNKERIYRSVSPGPISTANATSASQGSGQRHAPEGRVLLRSLGSMSSTHSLPARLRQSASTASLEAAVAGLKHLMVNPPGNNASRRQMKPSASVGHISQAGSEDGLGQEQVQVTTLTSETLENGSTQKRTKGEASEVFLRRVTHVSIVGKGVEIMENFNLCRNLSGN